MLVQAGCRELFFCLSDSRISQKLPIWMQIRFQKLNFQLKKILHPWPSYALVVRSSLLLTPLP